MCSGMRLPPLGGGHFGLYSHEVVLVKSGVRRVSALGMLGVWGRRAKASVHPHSYHQDLGAEIEV